MASKLCCTVEQDGRSDSPELPNVRVTEATPVRQPLLDHTIRSENSQFTSARSEELRELHQIFDNATDREDHQPSPRRPPRSRFNRPSVYSLHSLHKMKSMHSIIRQKFSKELANKSSAATVGSAKLKKKSKGVGPDTVIQQPRNGPNLQLGITKDDLRRNLLSDKKSNEGGYDSDAEVLDDVARNVGKKSPGKRPSVHSIEWTPSAGRPTPGSSSKSRENPHQGISVQPYRILKPQNTSLSARFSHVFSTPNLRADAIEPKDRKARRSYSATSLDLPSFSPLSPLRLPSFAYDDKNEKSWGIEMNESLRLSQFPVPPRPISPSPPNDSMRVNKESRVADGDIKGRKSEDHETGSSQGGGKDQQLNSTLVEIRVQEPTATTTPRPSTSIKGSVGGDSDPMTKEVTDAYEGEDGGNRSRNSVHLYSMRISHHLRSGSLLSWDQLAEATSSTTPPYRIGECAVSDNSQQSHLQRQPARHERQSSSSGFASSKVPSRWGRVVPQNRDHPADIASSIYSSRPHSPPDSFSGCAQNLTRVAPGDETLKRSSMDLTNLRRSASYPTDNDDTPRPLQRFNAMTNEDTTAAFITSSPFDSIMSMDPKRSTSYSKKSKFREEFSPPPPKKRITPSASIMRLFAPKRASIRSQSEANLKPEGSKPSVAHSLDTTSKSIDRSHRISRSLMSLKAEQEALETSERSNTMWDRALMVHQEEKESLFLPTNKQLAAHSSPFRERSYSGSISKRSGEQPDALEEPQHTPKRFSAPAPKLLHLADNELEHFSSAESRRGALIAGGDDSPDQAIQTAFENQMDNTETVGAWGRYPSHTRPERTFSADHQDHVDTRDFAIQTSVKFTRVSDKDMDEGQLSPSTRMPSPSLFPGQKKRKKRIGSSRMVKSNSMTFGKTFLKNYARIFKSQSTEFQKHGHGHRSSIATGGVLEYPELEILPDFWTPLRTEGTKKHSDRNLREKDAASGDAKVSGKLRMEDSSSTLRPRRNSSAPNLQDSPKDGNQAINNDHGNDSARVWSVYYENCVPSFPRLSVDADLNLEDFSTPARHSLDGKRASMHSSTMPAHVSKHSRHGSRMSRISVFSRASARPSFVSSREGDLGVDERSIVSVRRSTMDLVALYKQQEDTEHQRVLGLVRGESQRERDHLAGL